jgi:capsular polysaccharide biosynthesis protein
MAANRKDLVAMSYEPRHDVLSRGAHEGNYVLSLGDILRVLLRRWWIIALLTLATLGAAVGYSFFQTPEYEASTTLLIGQTQNDSSSSTNLSASDLQGLQYLTKTMAAAISSDRIAEAVIQDLHLSTTPDDLQKNLSAQQVPETQFIQITYQSTDPEMAKRIVGATAYQFSRQIADISPNASAVTATVWDKAAVSDTPVSPNRSRDSLLGFAVGAMLGVLLAFFLENLDRGWRSVEEIERASRLPALGVIPRFEAPRDKSRKRD